MTEQDTAPSHPSAADINRWIAVREIDSESELHLSGDWATMCGIDDPDYLVADLLGFHQDGLSVATEGPGPGHRMPCPRHTASLPPLRSRTSDLVAVANGRLVGGVLSGARRATADVDTGEGQRHLDDANHSDCWTEDVHIQPDRHRAEIGRDLLGLLAGPWVTGRTRRSQGSPGG